VQVYCTLMIASTWLLLLELHVENIFINLDYAHLATLNSLLTGMGVDVACSYWLIYKHDMGVEGAAYTQIIVKAARLALWALFALRYRLTPIFCDALLGRANEPIFAPKELRTYWNLAATTLLSNFSGWLIFELQILALAQVEGISQAALAAGAIWIQLESTLAAIQTGWLATTSMRTLVLLGKLDPGASKAFALLCCMSAGMVAVTNIPLLIFAEDIANLLSNDEDVRWYLRQVVWVLAVHAQTRISCINANCLFIPIGKGTLGVVQVFVSFYLLAVPVVCVLALTDLVTRNVTTKLTFVVAGTALGQVAIAIMGFAYLLHMDWNETAKVIEERANSDKLERASSANSDTHSACDSPMLTPLSPKSAPATPTLSYVGSR